MMAGDALLVRRDARGNLTECRYDKLGRKVADILPVTTGIDDGRRRFRQFGHLDSCLWKRRRGR